MVSTTAMAGRTRTAETWIARFDRILGGTTILLTLALVGLWLAGRGDAAQHGGVFSFIGAALIGPSGPLFLVAARAMSHGWRLRWLVQLLPFVSPFVMFVLVLPGS